MLKSYSLTNNYVYQFIQHLCAVSSQMKFEEFPIRAGSEQQKLQTLV